MVWVRYRYLLPEHSSELLSRESLSRPQSDPLTAGSSSEGGPDIADEVGHLKDLHFHFDNHRANYYKQSLTCSCSLLTSREISWRSGESCWLVGIISLRCRILNSFPIDAPAMPRMAPVREAVMDQYLVLSSRSLSLS